MRFTISTQCKTGKRQYATQKEAEAIVSRMLRQRKRRKPDKKLKAYLCDICYYWHIGHQSRERKQL